MVFSWKEFCVVLFLVASANAQADLHVTASDSLTAVYQDGVQVGPTPGADRWSQIDVLPIDSLTRLVAVRASHLSYYHNVDCTGILVAVDFHASGAELKTNGVNWKCFENAPAGWQELGFDDSKWKAAHQVGRNGAIVPGCSWLPLRTLPEDAYWIWTDRDMYGTFGSYVSCRGYTTVCQDASPCQNGGSCLPNSQQLCSCPYGFTGRFCETALPAQVNLLITATHTLAAVYQDGVQVGPTPNGNKWNQVDVLAIDSLTRLVAVRATNVYYGCAGILASLDGHPYGLELKTNSVSWKCSSSLPAGWQELGFDDSIWERADQAGRNGAIVPGCSWIPILTMPTDAYWIWTQQFYSGQEPVVACRGYTTICEDTRPCQNGGSCLRNSPALCACADGFTGRLCESSISA